MLVSSIVDIHNVTDHLPDVFRVKCSGVVTPEDIAGVENLEALDGDVINFPFYGLVTSDGKQVPLDRSISAKYGFHRRAHFRKGLEAGVAALGGECRVNAYWNDGYFATLERLDDEAYQVSGNPRDIVRTKFWLHMPYSSSCRIGLCMDVAVCRNKMIWQTMKSTVRTVRHCLSFDDLFENVVRDFEAVGRARGPMLERIQLLSEKVVDINKFGVHAMATGPEMSKQLENRFRALSNRVMREYDALGYGIPNLERVSGWRVYNALQGYFQHEATRKNSADDIFRAVRTWEGDTARDLTKAEEYLLAC